MTFAFKSLLLDLVPEIISIGKYGRKIGFFESLMLQVKAVVSEFTNLDIFTKLTIIFVILLSIAVFRASGEILQKFTSASENVQVGSVLPDNCHIAVDLSKCPMKNTCQPSPIIVCDKEGK